MLKLTKIGVLARYCCFFLCGLAGRPRATIPAGWTCRAIAVRTVSMGRNTVTNWEQPLTSGRQRVVAPRA